MARVRVEFFGTARLRAETPERTVIAATVRAALIAVMQAFPRLELLRDGEIAKEFLLSVNGGRFVDVIEARLNDGDCLVILGADAGG